MTSQIILESIQRLLSKHPHLNCTMQYTSNNRALRYPWLSIYLISPSRLLYQLEITDSQELIIWSGDGRDVIYRARLAHPDFYHNLDQFITNQSAIDQAHYKRYSRQRLIDL